MYRAFPMRKKRDKARQTMVTSVSRRLTERGQFEGGGVYLQLQPGVCPRGPGRGVGGVGSAHEDILFQGAEESLVRPCV